ncbi:peptidoglycan-associated lipoprotein [Helicobacter apodemus]|uniref:Peptidoglycan-associated lipoprotein n=1 Tax=Helicobacter apodemus TaxID=135569 RepID=A0A4U8UCP0_9HELI|nr:OmpA family protein [Helicobacter apodemus]TLE14811.1 peptidoglycan-associated lipoprotein [Helicobacter apodemus]
MKRLLVLSSLVAVLLIAGCSQKGSVQSSSSSNSYGQSANNGKGYVAGKDNFANLEERIKYVDSNLQNVFFNFDQFTIRPDMQRVVDNNANVLLSPAIGTLSVRIEGNTDEWGTDEYNYALGLKRAVAVRESLVAKGVDQNKTILVSYGESKPTCTSKTRECWAENRKVTFKILP